ncbi:MAG: YbjN domain-containing protein [Chloroflexota bacterium]|nr:YbjN domain-containing protein [Chloroflexota bacterium]
MGAIFDAMVDFFKSDDWSYSQIEGKPVLWMDFVGKSGRWTCFAREDEEKQMFLFHSYLPVKAPEEKRPVLSDMLTRANYGLYIGNFELDFNDGEVRFKTSIDVENDRLSHALAKGVVYANVAIMDKYLPGIMSVIYGGASPTEAIAQVES